MKRTILLILLVVSLSMNVAVAATVIWHLWSGPQPSVNLVAKEETPLNKDDVRQITAAMPRDGRAEMMELHGRIRDKKLEVLELITKNPGNLKAAEEKIDELAQLRGQMERKALTRISEIMGTLPQEKRTAFFGFLRSRACMGPGMGCGMMKRGMGPGMGRGRGMSPGTVPLER